MTIRRPSDAAAHRPGQQAAALLREIATAERVLDDLKGRLATVQEMARAAITDYTGLPPAEPKRRQHRSPCSHGLMADFVVANGVGKDGRPVYRCSFCGAEDTWEDGWCYYGNLECLRCGWAVVERVHCPVCAVSHDAATTPHQAR